MSNEISWIWRTRAYVAFNPNSSVLNNNQVEQENLGVASESEVIENCNDTASEKTENYLEQSRAYEIQGFRVAEDTTTRSSVAVARSNVNIHSKRINNNINNNLSVSRLSLNSSAESLSDYDAHDLSGSSECSDNSEDAMQLPKPCRGIINPNYPGFQHLAPSFLSVFTEEDQLDSRDLSPCVTENLKSEVHEYFNNNKEPEVEKSEEEEGEEEQQEEEEEEDQEVEVEEEEEEDAEVLKNSNVNHLDGRTNKRKFFYEKSKLNIQQTVTSFYEDIVSSSEKCLNYVKSIEQSKGEESEEDNLAHWQHIPVEIKVADLQSTSTECLQFPEIEKISLDSVKISDHDSEPEEVVIERIDLIADVTRLEKENDKVQEEEKEQDSSDTKFTTNLETVSDQESLSEEQLPYTKLDEIDLLSSIGRDIGVVLEKYIQPVPDVIAMETVDVHNTTRAINGLMKDTMREDTNILIDQVDLMESTSADSRKKEKMARNQARRRQQSHTGQRRPDKRRVEQSDKIPSGGFDVYNIETAMPKIDLDAIETHLRAAREEERRLDEDALDSSQERNEAVAPGHKWNSHYSDQEDLIARFDQIVQQRTDVRRNDREEIRRRLAMGPDADDIRTERGRKPSLQSRLQSGMNLQICFMNETPSDTESPGSENDGTPVSTKQTSHLHHHQQQQQQQQLSHSVAARPQVLNLPSLRLETNISSAPLDEADFFARQARLQTEARMALAQAKEMAHMQMEVERQRLKQSPITEMVRSSLEKVGVQLGEDRRRLSRVLLTELNVAQLQVVANDLHARIAVLNEALVEGLLRRDDLHMEQDSMLVDVEDLTRYLGAKQDSFNKRQANIKKKTTPMNKQMNQQQKHQIHQQQQEQGQQKQQPHRVLHTSMMTMMMPTIRTKLANRGLVGLVRK